jgi:hypothetical protein
MYGKHNKPHLYELIQQTADHYHWDVGKEKWGDLKKIGLSGNTDEAGGGHAHCGMMIYQGDNWPKKYRGKLFTANFHGRRLNCERLERSGAGYVGKHEPDFLKVKDLWFRGVELDYGFDGSVYLLDWSDVGECHENDGLHRSSGRIFRITHGEIKPIKINLANLKSAELAKIQLHPNERFARHARRLLQERAGAGQDLSLAKKKLDDILSKNPEVSLKLRALWCLYAMGSMDKERLATLLLSKEEHIRVWGIQFLVDHGSPQFEISELLASLAKKEKSGLVRLYLASALRRLPVEKRWSLANTLAQSDDLAEDPMFPLLLWYGIEPAIAQNTTAALKLVGNTKIPKLRQFIARRLAEDSE